jgi:hypothetical protein
MIRQFVPLKRRSTIILHGSTSQKTILNFMYLYNEQILVAWLVGQKLLLLRDFGPYVVMFMSVFLTITVAVLK